MNILLFLSGFACCVVTRYMVIWGRRRFHKAAMARWERSRWPYWGLLTHPLSEWRWMFGRICRGWFRCQECNGWANTEMCHCQYWGEGGKLVGVCPQHHLKGAYER